MFKVQSFQPHQLLQAYIVSYLILHTDFPDEGNQEMVILPHLIQNITFNLGPVNSIYDIVNCEYSAPDFIVGPNDNICKIRIAAGMKSFVVNLRPGAWFKLFRIPAHYFNNKSRDLFDVVGPQMHEIGERIRECATGEQQVRILETFLIHQLLLKKTHSRNIDEAIQLIYSANGNITIRQLEFGTYLTKRTLERNFLEQTGVHLKTFCRIVRFRRTIEYIEREPSLQWIQLAEKFGYCDQSHFIHEFKHFSGYLPHVYPGFRGDLEQALGL
ncbi:AraC-type DNA-binding protein [Chitinophaga sp. CF118]|uniref:AraC family transcriptional regulator n=1 Tax=Chitinophaga sp. CF118 TaxID=1884367 RepID=UPI0008EBF020|nr:helix-turn-helix domain-containing protein [Chitinophaga sp. CF118]SFE46608.1 AraC-type DNA-binding protein [Chitinophaga sp. CF118]